MLHARRTPSSVARLRSHGYVSSHSPDMLVWGLAIAAEYLASTATVRLVASSRAGFGPPQSSPRRSIRCAARSAG
jgi:hypothetical protein